MKLEANNNHNRGRQRLTLALALQCVIFAAQFNCQHSFSFIQQSATNQIIRRWKCNNEHEFEWKILSHQNIDIDSESAEEEEENAIESNLLLEKQQSLRSNTLPPLDIRRAMQMMGTSPRRVFLSVASSTTIALVANLFGVTSTILSQLPEEFSEQTGLDYVYPRDGFKRVSARSSLGVGGAGKCSFLIPKDWVADTGLALAQAQRRAKALDLSMSSNAKGASILPDAAFGPPGKLDSQGLSNGDTNVSVIINTDVKNFSLKESLGDPNAAAEKLISARFRRPTTLLSAVEVGQGQSSVYQFEYIVDRGEKALPLRAISVIAGYSDGNSYITLTVVSPSMEWDKPLVSEKLRKIVNSLKLN
jgi:hypothetical protein